MANPTVSLQLNKSTFAPGELGELTVTYGDADNTSTVKTITVTGTDQDGNEAVATVSYTVKNTDTVTLTVTDSSGAVLTQVSDVNGVRKYRFTAAV